MEPWQREAQRKRGHSICPTKEERCKLRTYRNKRAQTSQHEDDLNFLHSWRFHGLHGYVCVSVGLCESLGICAAKDVLNHESLHVVSQWKESKRKTPNHIIRIFCDALYVESIIWTVQMWLSSSCCIYFIFVGKNGIFLYMNISIYRYITITFQNAAKTQVVFPNKQSIYWKKPRQCCVVKCLVLLRILVLLGHPLLSRTSGGTGEFSAILL